MRVEILEAILMDEHVGKRLDKALADLFPDFSRSFLQESIKQGCIVIDKKVPRARDRVMGGEHIVFTVKQNISNANDEFIAQELPLDIVHEDADILVLNKAAGVVVHPAAGHPQGTLVNALIYHCPELRQLPRAGLVHRLDKDTTGLLVVAKNRAAHQSLVSQMQERQIRREYLSLVHGEVIAGGTIQTNFGRHVKDRKRMAVVVNGQIAITHYRIETRFKDYTLLRVRLGTGRTHQIRVHMAHIHHPVFGDLVYGKRKLPRAQDAGLSSVMADFKRQALHAYELEFIHPTAAKQCAWRHPPPPDMQTLIDVLTTTDA